MQYRLMFIYNKEAERTYTGLLREDDIFSWSGSLKDDGIVNKESIMFAFIGGNLEKRNIVNRLTGEGDDTLIEPYETIHIVGDFDSLIDVYNWLETMRLLGLTSREELRTLTK